MGMIDLALYIGYRRIPAPVHSDIAGTQHLKALKGVYGWRAISKARLLSSRNSP
jgi:hypothetical protein